MQPVLLNESMIMHYTDEPCSSIYAHVGCDVLYAYIHVIYVCAWASVSCSLPPLHGGSQLWIGLSCGRVLDKIDTNEETKTSAYMELLVATE